MHPRRRHRRAGTQAGAEVPRTGRARARRRQGPCAARRHRRAGRAALARPARRGLGMTSVRPLAGLKVLEIGHSIAAPYAGLILAELGAEVVKLENPEDGDYARGWGPPFA